MRRRLVCLALPLALGSAVLLAPLRADTPMKEAPAARTLPGVKEGGVTLLPNGWSLKPAGKHIPARRLPRQPRPAPRRPVAGRPARRLRRTRNRHRRSRSRRSGSSAASASTRRFYGLCFAPDGKTLYASGGEFEVVHAFDFDDGLLSRPPRDHRSPTAKEKFVVGRPRRRRATARRCSPPAPGATPSAVVPLDEPGRPPHASPSEKGSYPYACLPDAEGERLFVSLWGKAGRRRHRPGRRSKVVATWPTESHPTEMALSPDGKTLFVACANSTQVSVLDAATTARRWRRSTAPSTRTRPSGNTPNSLCLTPDGQTAVRRQRRRQQPRRLQRRRAGQGQAARLHPRRLVSDLACATTRPTSASTSPTARG